MPFLNPVMKGNMMKRNGRRTLVEDLPLIIAEIKTKSPFGWKSELSFDALLEIAVRIGDVIAIHTDPRWGGSFELLREVARAIRKPILAKGFHEDDDLVRKAFDAGANFVLVVGRISLVQPEKCFVEPYTLRELKNFPIETRVVWNSRDLMNQGKPKTERFEQARRMWDGFLCQASNIRSVKDVKQGADAVLVGAYLPEFAKSLKVLRDRQSGS